MGILKKSTLFEGNTEEEIQSMLKCMGAKRATYGKGNYIFNEGQTIHEMGLILTGKVQVIKEDFWGNRTILAQLKEGELFGETYAYVEGMGLEVSVLASEKTEILFLDCKKILHICPSSCQFHQRAVKNLLKIMAEKNLQLSEKITYLSKRTTREKILSFLSGQAKKAGSYNFEIPFNRQEMADYLGVDRSALSKELGKLKRESILTFQKNRFSLTKELSGYSDSDF